MKSDGYRLIGSGLHGIRTERGAAAEQPPMSDGLTLPTDHNLERSGSTNQGTLANRPTKQ